MEWCNKIDKGKIKIEWTPVSAPTDGNAAYKAMTWCEDHHSTGEFYFEFVNHNWYFENESDALLFALRWGN